MYQLAQLNIAKFKYAPGDPGLQGFMDALDGINEIADQSPGFVWRLEDESGNATGIRAFDDPHTLVNMSVWEDVDSLQQFVYKSGHMPVMRRRAEWANRMETPYQVMWWVPAGHEPTLQEAIDKLDSLTSHGPTEEAFNFRTPFPPPANPTGEDS